MTPLAEAAAAAFPRVDLTTDEALRLAQGARLALPASAAGSGDLSHGTPLAAFDPDGGLVALVTAEDGRLRSLAVFVDAAAKTRDTETRDTQRPSGGPKYPASLGSACQSPMMRRIRTQLSRTGPHSRSRVAAR